MRGDFDEDEDDQPACENCGDAVATRTTADDVDLCELCYLVVPVKQGPRPVGDPSSPPLRGALVPRHEDEKDKDLSRLAPASATAPENLTHAAASEVVCECGYRAESPNTHPHVTGCPGAEEEP